MAKNYSDIVIALAGVSQAVQLVQQLAHQGQCDPIAEKVMIDSVLELNPRSTLGVYGDDLDHLRLGLETVCAILSTERRPQITEVTGYAVSAIMLAQRLNKNEDALNTLGNRFGDLERQQQFFDAESNEIYNALAGIYVDVIRPLGPPIQIRGNEQMLQNSLVQAKVRTLLLSAVRSAILWQQIGGSRWQILFSRRKLLNIAKSFLGYSN